MLFEKASRLKLRFSSARGLLSVEDLWDLNLTQLNTLAVSLKKKMKETAEESFLEEKSEEDTVVKLQFDITLNILETKKVEKKDREQASEKKIKNQKILGVIAERQDEELKSKSIEELTALLS